MELIYQYVSVCFNSWIGHVLRHEGLLKTILEGRMEGKAARGRKRLNMLSDILGKDTYVKVKRRAEDRGQWMQSRLPDDDVSPVIL